MNKVLKQILFIFSSLNLINKKTFAAPQYHFPALPIFDGTNFGQSSAQANANAFSNYNAINAFGSSVSNAGAQSFNSETMFGNFGASASNSQSQGFDFRQGKLAGNANFAGSQTYNFGDKKISIAYSNGWNVGPDGIPKLSNSNSVSFT